MIDAIWYGLQLLGLLVLFGIGWAVVTVLTRRRGDRQRRRPDDDQDEGEP